VLYTVIPFVIIAVLFYYTAISENKVNKMEPNPDVTVGVVGFQWNWQFNYVGDNVQVTGRPGEPPKLVLPTNRTIRFVETSPDVIHSFWVPAFLFKRDVVPGRDNQFEITITRTGNYIGRCAELCGVDHDRMDFFVQVLSPADFDKWLAATKAQQGASTQALGSVTPPPDAFAAGQPLASRPALTHDLPDLPAVLGSAL
jgi:cytochrome c oxidase subunit 2